MKYLKVTFLAFVVAFGFSVVNANARTLVLQDVTIPSFSGIYSTNEHVKGNENLQYIQKTGCTDDLTGDGRVILSKVHGTLTGMNDSNWVEAKPNQNISYGSNSRTVGNWKVYLKSNKSLATTASFWGVWTIE